MVKVLLIPLAIIAFIVFLIVLGAIGLGIAFVVISAFRGIWRLLTRAGHRERKRESVI